jgi:hypothetical protein
MPPRRRSSPVRGGRGKSQRLAKLDPTGASQRGVLAAPPEGKSPAGNLGRQLRAKLKGLFPPVTLNPGVQKFGEVFDLFGKKKDR